MSSLAELPELVGFFSYSRKDDEQTEGALSRLRARIYRELRLQLGRDFRLWQDVAAIPDGALWEAEIRRAIAELVFFIPIVTPSAIASRHCKFEFDAFLEREAALGRSNLIFPILYIRVPALESEAIWRRDDLLKIVGARQYTDWRNSRHRDLASPDVAEKVEHFCRNIFDALHQPWISPEERARREAAEAGERAEAEKRAKAAAEAERQRLESEAAAKQEDAARERARAEEGAKVTAEIERKRLETEAAAKRRAEEEARARAAAVAERRRLAKEAAAKRSAEERALADKVVREQQGKGRRESGRRRGCCRVRVCWRFCWLFQASGSRDHARMLFARLRRPPKLLRRLMRQWRDHSRRHRPSTPPPFLISRSPRRRRPHPHQVCRLPAPMRRFRPNANER